MNIQQQNDFKAGLLVLANANFDTKTLTSDDYEWCEMATKELRQLIPRLPKEFNPMIRSFLTDTNKNKQIAFALSIKTQLENVGFFAENAHQIAFGSYTHLRVGNYANGHYVKKLEDWIRLFYNIRYIDAYNNHFEEIPKIIQEMPHIEVLHFGINNIRQLPKWLYDISTLKRLIIGSNPMKAKTLSNFIHNAPTLLQHQNKKTGYGIFDEIEDPII